MPRTYADLLREARSQIREVTPQEVDALPEGGAAVIDVREDSEWEQGHLPGAIHISKSYVEQQIEAAAPDRDAPVVAGHPQPAPTPPLPPRARHVSWERLPLPLQSRPRPRQPSRISARWLASSMAQPS